MYAVYTAVTQFQINRPIFSFTGIFTGLWIELNGMAERI
jgi:hypothetical protein